MAAITSIAIQGPPVLLGNAVGRAVIKEYWRVPASTAGDTQTIVSPNIAQVIAVTGNAQHTAVTDAETGSSIPLTTLDTVSASNFAWVEVTGFARKVHSGGAA